ncbi:MAG: hypothetical protein QXS54_11670 [Candidatus Methanomethylicaceae archaeon]
MSILTEADKFFLPMARRENGGFSLACKWYTGIEPTDYQVIWHHLANPNGEPIANSTVVAGIATGKTTIAALSYLIDCISIPYFNALNTSVTAKQAELAFDMIMGWVDGNPKLEHLIKSVSGRPFPSIEFHNGSVFDFRTAGSNGRFLRGSEYDRANFDEAGLDMNGEIIKILRGRLRGTRSDGTKRMARLDAISSPTDALWLRERFDRGWPQSALYDPALYRSMRIATWDNPHITKEQLEAMKADYPPDWIEVELGGNFPDYGNSLFPSKHVMACVDQSIYDEIYEAVSKSKPEPGYDLVEDHRHGIIHYEMPPIPGHTYVMAGDPGISSYPHRNAPVIIVVDATQSSYRVVYFDWGAGKGSYRPFIEKYRYCVHKYNPILRGIDATGTQKGLDEIAFEESGIVTDKLDFISQKNTMLNYLQMDIVNQKLSFAPAKGITRQLMSYTYESDKEGQPQDIVMALAMIAFEVRSLPSVETTTYKMEWRGNRIRYRKKR